MGRRSNKLLDRACAEKRASENEYDGTLFGIESGSEEKTLENRQLQFRRRIGKKDTRTAYRIQGQGYQGT